MSRLQRKEVRAIDIAEISLYEYPVLRSNICHLSHKRTAMLYFDAKGHMWPAMSPRHATCYGHCLLFSAQLQIFPSYFPSIEGAKIAVDMRMDVHGEKERKIFSA